MIKDVKTLHDRVDIDYKNLRTTLLNKEQRTRIDDIIHKTWAHAHMLVDTCRSSRELSLALTLVEQSCHMAIASIEKEEHDG